MQTRRTQCGWIALGGTLCLLGLGLVVKLRDGNRASAQTQLPPHATVAAAAGSLANALFGPIQLAQADTLKPIPQPASMPPGSSVIYPAPEVPEPLPAGLREEKKETAEPPIILPVDYQVKELQKPSKPMVQPGPAALPAPLPGAAPLPKLSELPPSSEPPPPLSVPAPAQASKPLPTLSVLPVSQEKPVSRPGTSCRAPGGLETPKSDCPSAICPAASTVPPLTVTPVEKTEYISGLKPAADVPEKSVVVPVSMEEVKPLPNLRVRTTPPKARPMPLTGTFVGTLDGRRVLVLPHTLCEQLGADGNVLVSPGSDTCLWLTTPAHLERLAERLEHSRARETDIQAFRRLYFAQAEKLTIGSEGRLVVPERLAQFAGLDKEVVLVGIDDHIEVWDAARWKRYTQEKSAAVRAAIEPE